jgi:hypothetical protein
MCGVWCRFQDEKTRLPKRGGDDVRKRKAKIDAELEDLEHDSAYFISTTAYIDEVNDARFIRLPSFMLCACHATSYIVAQAIQRCMPTSML